MIHFRLGRQAGAKDMPIDPERLERDYFERRMKLA
jgi:hypothetical protein